jgi:hypothetical protein
MVILHGARLLRRSGFDVRLFSLLLPGATARE